MKYKNYIIISLILFSNIILAQESTGSNEESENIENEQVSTDESQKKDLSIFGEFEYGGQTFHIISKKNYSNQMRYYPNTELFFNFEINYKGFGYRQRFLISKAKSDEYGADVVKDQRCDLNFNRFAISYSYQKYRGFYSEMSYESDISEEPLSRTTGIHPDLQTIQHTVDIYYSIYSDNYSYKDNFSYLGGFNRSGFAFVLLTSPSLLKIDSESSLIDPYIADKYGEDATFYKGDFKMISLLPGLAILDHNNETFQASYYIFLGPLYQRQNYFTEEEHVVRNQFSGRGIFKMYLLKKAGPFIFGAKGFFDFYVYNLRDAEFDNYTYSIGVFSVFRY